MSFIKKRHSDVNMKFFPKYTDKGTLTRIQRFSYDPKRAVFSSFEQKMPATQLSKNVIPLHDDKEVHVTHFPHLATTYVSIHRTDSYNYVDPKGAKINFRDILPESIIKSWNLQFEMQRHAVEIVNTVRNKSIRNRSYNYFRSAFNDPQKQKSYETFCSFQSTTGEYSSLNSDYGVFPGRVIIKYNVSSSKGNVLKDRYLETGIVNQFSYETIKDGQAFFQFGNAGIDIVNLAMPDNNEDNECARGWRVIFDANNYKKTNPGLLAH